MNSTKQCALDVSLQQVIDELEKRSSPARYGGLLLASELIINYFGKPATQITIRALRMCEPDLPRHLLRDRQLQIDVCRPLYRESQALIAEAKAIARMLTRRRNDFAAAVRRIAEGKIRCECGNSSWKTFFFAGVPPVDILGGCETCGHVYIHKAGVWELQSLLRDDCPSKGSVTITSDRIA